MAERQDLEAIKEEVKKKEIPRHIAIIMDGNGRWATGRNLPRISGHRQGVNTVRKIIKFSQEIGIKYLTLFAFSTENWQRPKEEVRALMGLLKEFLRRETKSLIENNIRLIVIGRKLGLSLQREIDRVCELTKNNTSVVLTLAINYGGRTEIIDAVNNILQQHQYTHIDEEVFEKFLYTGKFSIPHPDLFIRTSGENRISNFLLYQIAYTELYVTDELWPDFNEFSLLEAILDYQRRERRFGGIKT